MQTATHDKEPRSPTSRSHAGAVPASPLSGWVLVAGASLVAAVVFIARDGWKPPRDRGALSASPPPARVDRGVAESALTTVHLSSAARGRIGVELAPVREMTVDDVQLRRGVIEIPDHGRARLLAPVAGTLLADGPALRVGDAVRAGDVVARIRAGQDAAGRAFVINDELSLVRLHADIEGQRAAATGRLSGAQVAVEAAQAALDRASTLEQQSVGSARRVEEAKAALGAALADRDAARALLDTLARASDQVALVDGGASIAIRSPLNAVVRATLAHPGDSVTAGALLVELVDPSQAWVRVPVLLTESDRWRDVAEVEVSAGERDPGVLALRIANVDRGDVTTGTVDLVYALTGATAMFSPGQPVAVKLSLGSAVRSVVPRASVVYDSLGGAWVYLPAEEGAFRRERVDVAGVVDGGLALSRGPAAGTSVVVAGAAELLGVEFGAGK